MESVLILILKILGGSGLCYLACLFVKCFAIVYICKHPELSDQKVKAITKMVSKGKYKHKNS